MIGAVAVAAVVAGCSQPTLENPAQKPLSKDAMMLLGKKGMTPTQPIFVRVFKEESELEVWKQRTDGRYYHFKTYPICHWSGELGPKLKQGDKQAPEGFYSVKREQMNPASQFHLAFNLGYPNSFDKSHKRTGDALMVHGKCKSAGCYAMTDALIEEIYALAREAFDGGQPAFEVHAFPFRMTPQNLVRHQASPWMPFWQTLQEGHDYFEVARVTPTIAVCQKKYVVNVKLKPNMSRPDPDGPCPAFERPPIDPFKPMATPEVTATAPRAGSSGAGPAQMFGLTGN